MHGSGLGYQAPSRDTMHSANSPSVRMPRPMIVLCWHTLSRPLRATPEEHLLARIDYFRLREDV